MRVWNKDERRRAELSRAPELSRAELSRAELSRAPELSRAELSRVQERAREGAPFPQPQDPPS